MRTALFVALGIGGCLAGCAVVERSFSGPSAGSNCSADQCRVRVSVGPDCKPVATPDELVVPPGGDMKILWMIDPPSAPYVFDANGISFKQAPHLAQFDQKRAEQQGKAFHWRDRNTDAGRYRYDINLRDAQGRLCHVDPFIRNQ